MTRMKTLALAILLPAIGAATVGFSQTANKPAASTAPLVTANSKLSRDQADVTRVVYGLLSDSRYTYRTVRLDDKLSASIYKNYLESLDPGKMIFTAQDVARFSAYQNVMDDSIKSQQFKPAFDMFLLYQQRLKERVAFARSVLAKPIDYSVKETWMYDREDAPWPKDAAEANDNWRKYVKNDALRLKLAGRSADEIRTTLDKRYARMLDRPSQMRVDDVFEMFLNSYTKSVDPHTDYFSPRSAEGFNMQMRLSLQGIGAVLQNQDDYSVIRTLVAGGPAQRSTQLQVGDRVLAVGQGDKGPMVDVVGWRIDDVVELIRGKKGTKVRLDVLPAEAGLDGKHKLITLIRDEVKLEDEAAKKRVLNVQNKKIGVIELPSFYADFKAIQEGRRDARRAGTDVARLLRELRAENVDGIVMDLRNNGGGSLAEAVELTGFFIDRGPVLQQKDVSGRVVVHRDQNSGVLWDGPLAVLTNRSSASASEIFAAAIQDYGRGLIIGEKTFGKGTVQDLFEMDRGMDSENPRYGMVKYTVAQFFRIDGGTTQNAAVSPDLSFPVSFDVEEFGESSFDNALPYTRITPAPHNNLANFAPLLPALNARHKARVSKDKEFSWWLQDVAEYKTINAKKIISLNETERRAERDRLEAMRKARVAERKALGLQDVDSREDDGLQDTERSVAAQVAAEERAKNLPDPLLRETANILADSVQLLSTDPKLTAQVLPTTKQAKVWSN
jgi:carboxyl-terminal processing protease